MKNGPRPATIRDISNRSSAQKLKKVNPKELSESIRNDHGIEPEKKAIIYDSYVDKIIKTVGQDVSDQMFEQAKEIIYRKAIELQLSNKNTNIQHSTDNIMDSITVDDGINNVKINKVPGPKRKNKGGDTVER